MPNTWQFSETSVNSVLKSFSEQSMHWGVGQAQSGLQSNRDGILNEIANHGRADFFEE